jgi:hypothetical protein
MSIVQDTAENPSSEKVRLGAGCRVNPPPPVVGENFLLTSPFIESPDFFVPPLPYPLCTLISTQGHPIPGPRHARFSRGGVEGTQGQAEGRNPKMRKPDLKPGGNTKLVDRRHPRLRSCLQTNNETMLAWLPLRSDKNR